MAINHREDPTFRPEYVETYYEDEPRAPFPVTVFGIDPEKTFLGVGRVIGAIDMELSGTVDPHPVIEVIDTEDGQPYTVLGLESWWTHPVPEEVVEGIATGKMVVSSVRQYLEGLQAEQELRDAADSAWLKDQGIDPV